MRIDLQHSLGDYLVILDEIFTGEDGRFRFPHLLPGGNYRVVAMGGPIRFLTLHESLDPKPGEAIDLGDIDFTSDARPAVK